MWLIACANTSSGCLGTYLSGCHYPPLRHLQTSPRRVSRQQLSELLAFRHVDGMAVLNRDGQGTEVDSDG